MTRLRYRRMVRLFLDAAALDPLGARVLAARSMRGGVELGHVQRPAWDVQHVAIDLDRHVRAVAYPQANRTVPGRDAAGFVEYQGPFRELHARARKPLVVAAYSWISFRYSMSWVMRSEGVASSLPGGADFCWYSAWKT
jgi:hypothetical protein